jgi:hypothetical protein
MLAVDINTGEIVIFDETTPREFITTAIVSTASIPGFFPINVIHNMALVDGGIFANVDFSESILKCRDLGFEDKDIILDAIMCFGNVVKIEQWTTAELKFKNAYDLYRRNSELREFYSDFEDIIRVVRGYPDVELRHLITPTRSLAGGFVPIFDGSEEILELLRKGELDGKLHTDYFFEKTKLNKEKAEKEANKAKTSPSKSDHPNVKSSNCDNEERKPLMGFDVFREAIRLYDQME